MSGEIYDLNRSNILIPRRVAFDTNVLATQLFAPSTITPDLARRRRRVAEVLRAVKRNDGDGIVVPTVFRELVHLAIRARFIRYLATYADSIGGKKGWELLFKARPDLLRQYAPMLLRLPTVLSSMRMTILQLTDMEPLAANERFETDLLAAVLKYQLSSSDASILNELRRAGIDSIVTEDPDLRRAAGDFNVYTWL